MASDSQGSVILFGGVQGAGNLLADTWEWDGSAWSNPAPGITPPPLAFASMAPGVSGTAWLFGGADDTGDGLDQLWMYNSGSWSNMNGSIGNMPPPRQGAAMTFDGTYIWLFGGLSNDRGPLNDLWRLNVDLGATEWEQIHFRDEIPLPRYDHAIATSGDWLHITGGRDADGNVLSDIRALQTADADPANWTWALIGDPNSLGPRAGHSIAVLPTGELLLVGGVDDMGAPVGGAMEWLSGWYDTGLTFPARTNTALAWDGAGLMFFGGGDQGRPVWSYPKVRDDSWELIAGNWTQDLAAGPYKRELAAYATMHHYNASTSTVYVFGGRDPDSGVYLNDLWSFDGTTWTEETQNNRIAPRAGATMTYNPCDGTLWLFGGFTGSQLSNELYQFDSGTWFKRTTSGAPTPRMGASMAFDPYPGSNPRGGTCDSIVESRSVVLYGGANELGPQADLYTFTMDETGSGTISFITHTFTSQAGPRIFPALATVGDGVHMVGGYTYAPAPTPELKQLDDTLVFDTQIPVDMQPVGGASAISGGGAGLAVFGSHYAGMGTGDVIVVAGGTPDAMDEVVGKVAVHLFQFNSGPGGFDDLCHRAVGTTTGEVYVDTGTYRKGDGSAYFDNDNDRVAWDIGPSADLGTSDFTLDFWAQPVGSIAGNNVIVTMGGGPGSGRWYAQANVSRFTWHWERPTGGYFVSLISSNTFTDGSWYHYAVVRRGTSFYLFINGALEASATGVSGAIPDYNGTLYMGTDQGSPFLGGSPYGGYLDDVRFTHGLARWTTPFTPPNPQSNCLQ
jgi:hypothetical protein